MSNTVNHNQIVQLINLKKNNLLRIKDLLQTNNILELYNAKENQKYLNHCLSKFPLNTVKKLEVESSNKNSQYASESMFSNYISLNNKSANSISNVKLNDEVKYLFPGSGTVNNNSINTKLNNNVHNQVDANIKNNQEDTHIKNNYDTYDYLSEYTEY